MLHKNALPHDRRVPVDDDGHRAQDRRERPHRCHGDGAHGPRLLVVLNRGVNFQAALV